MIKSQDKTLKRNVTVLANTVVILNNVELLTVNMGWGLNPVLSAVER